MLVVLGGRCGVGATTLAVNLAASLAQQGRRVVLADAHLQRPQVAALCGLRHGLGVADILSAQRDIHEVLQPGPAGLQIVAGPATPHTAASLGPGAHQRLIDQLKSLGRHAETVVLDLGTPCRDVAALFWAAADQVLLVTRDDAQCIMDTYASIKLCADNGQPAPQLFTVVNRAESEASAIDVHGRISQSCRRFLALQLRAAGRIPPDDCLARAADHAVPATILSPTCPAARAIQRITAVLAASISAPADHLDHKPAA
jgi:flagellar biosynthesis protein FlhG